MKKREKRVKVGSFVSNEFKLEIYLVCVRVGMCVCVYIYIYIYIYIHTV